MKIENNIGWTDCTTNAVTGCDKVSPGCKNCYAESGTRARVLRAQGRETWGANGERAPVNFEPVFRRLNKLCVCDRCHTSYPTVQENLSCDEYSFSDGGCGGKLRRIRLFADSNSDWLDPKWPVETLARFLNAIRLAPNVDVQLLTKRIELFDLRMIAVRNYAAKTNADLALWIHEWKGSPPQSPKMLGRQAIAGHPAIQGTPPSNVWLGVSVEDQKRADERIPFLLKTPAAVRFLSCEPLLEPVHFDPRWTGACGRSGNNYQQPQVSWAIVGGESGKNRRDCGVEAIESAVFHFATEGIPVYCKQDSSFLSGQKGRLSDNAWSFKEFPR